MALVDGEVMKTGDKTCVLGISISLLTGVINVFHDTDHVVSDSSIIPFKRPIQRIWLPI